MDRGYGHILVADNGLSCVFVFDADGKFLFQVNYAYMKKRHSVVHTNFRISTYLIASSFDDDDDDEDEVCRVCKTPGDSCGCTRQHSQRSGLLLPSPWIKLCPFSLLHYVVN